MQEFSLAFSRVSRPAVTANPEMKSRVVELLHRAFYNLHGQPIETAEHDWVSSITATGVQLSLDERFRNLPSREMIHLFENVIRISEEHLREARRHAAMASNVFYLKETALDSVVIDTQDITYHAVATTILGGNNAAHSGRVEVPKLGEPVA